MAISEAVNDTDRPGSLPGIRRRRPGARPRSHGGSLRLRLAAPTLLAGDSLRFGPSRHGGPARAGTVLATDTVTASQLGPLARPGPEAAAAVEIVIAADSMMFCAFLRLQRTAVATAVL